MKKLIKSSVAVALLALCTSQADAQVSFVNGVSLPYGGEIMSYDSTNNRLLTTNSGNGSHGVQIYTIGSNGSLAASTAVDLASVFGGAANISSISSVLADSRGFGVATVIPTTTTSTDFGRIAIFSSTDGTILKTLDVGYHPDSVTITPDGTKLLVTNEAEFVSTTAEATFARPGSISVIDISSVTTAADAGNLTSSNLGTYDFSDANLASGVTISGLRNPRLDTLTVKTPNAADIEPEYITATNTTLYVTLQESNAIATFDLETRKYTAIRELGTIAQLIDASDRDGTSNGKSISINDTVYGMPQPDTITKFTRNGTTYLITANEGDSRPDDGDKARGSELTANMSTAVAATATNTGIGRLSLLKDVGDTDGDGLIDRPIMMGTRSFSIWNADTGARVFDSGSMIEQHSATYDSTTFNMNDGSTSKYDERSDDKGPEPEALAFATIGSQDFVFVGNERQNGIYMFDINDLTNVKIYGYFNTTTNSADSGGAFISPESIVFIPAANNPSNKNLIVVGYEGTGSNGSIGVFEVSLAAPAFTSNASTSATQNGAFNYQVTAYGNPTAFTASGLPTGLSMNSTTGIISGTPTTTGVNSVTVNATNSVGTTSQTLSLAVNVANSTISRLSPPSALFSFGDSGAPYISRFLKGQRFDLQATVQPSTGLTVTSVDFQVNGTSIGTITSSTGGRTSLVSSGLTGVSANSVSANYRAYSTAKVGVHTLTAVATLSNGATVTANGNFEVVNTPAAGTKAKNLIIMIGDGMGSSHRTAARIVKNGVYLGKSNAPLAMDQFPFTGVVSTASLNSIVTDSAPGAACYSTGNKGNNNQQGVFPDDTTDNGDNPRVELIGEFLARTQGKSLGIITTSDVFDATPGAFGSHTQSRSAGTGICDFYLDEAASKSNLKVLMGGGRKWFLPSGTTGSARTTSTDYAYPSDVVSGWGLSTAGSASDTSRNLLSDFQTAGFTYASNKTEMNAVTANASTKLLGLFAFSNMNVALDKINGRRGSSTALNGGSVVAGYGFPDQPMLEEMTEKAIEVLKQNPNGFVLMIEGASIDKQAHNMDTERWIVDTIEFDNAAEKVRQYATNSANGQTLAVITADHECAGVAIIGGSLKTNANMITAAASGNTTMLRKDTVGVYEAASFPSYSLHQDGYPTTMDPDYKMLIGYAANADRKEDWLTNPLPLQDSQQPEGSASYASIKSLLPANPLARDANGFTITGHIDGTSAAHTANDIPLSAIGRGARSFMGTYDNTEVFFKMMQATIGGAAN
jgi:alkaline phosphatase